MSKRFKRGFTLIELLVVIAIIGILASVVLVSLQSARKKANDSRVISSVQQIRTVLEANFNGSANDYPALTSNLNTYRLAKRPAAGSANGGGEINTLIQDIIDQQTAGGLVGLWGVNSTGSAFVAGGTVAITKDASSTGGGTAWTATGYAIYAKLPSSSTNQAFCLDSKGKSKYTTYPTVVPSSANAVECQ